MPRLYIREARRYLASKKRHFALSSHDQMDLKEIYEEMEEIMTIQMLKHLAEDEGEADADTEAEFVLLDEMLDDLMERYMEIVLVPLDTPMPEETRTTNPERLTIDLVPDEVCVPRYLLTKEKLHRLHDVSRWIRSSDCPMVR